MRKAISLILLVCVFFLSCKKQYEVIPVDYNNWPVFASAAAIKIPLAARNAMEGVYSIADITNTFGELAALKWSYSIKGADTNYHLSGFFGKDISYFICEGKQLGDSLLFNGYWRKMVGTETGIMRLTVSKNKGAGLLLAPAPVIDSGSVVFTGLFGNGQETPGFPIAFTYRRKLHKNTTPFEIVAHRSGGRTSDLLQVSENSVEMILKTPEFGSTGVEVDVRFTKDGVPILYHDNFLNPREVQKSGLIGHIENYTYDQLSTFVRLVHGEKIPTLREALNAVLYQTPLSFVWLDTKYVGSVAPVEAIQKEFLQKAAAAGRNLRIMIGLPGKEQYFQFLALQDYKNTPSLCELTPEDVTVANSKIWAPRFTEGIQTEKVAAVHAEGRQVFVWTVDVPDFVEEFVNSGDFDGILSNFPSSVAYNYYVRQ
ncbi:MAG: glycerophosphodiester phosphodiesterase family protein [Chitinophagaceae bacterium]